MEPTEKNLCLDCGEEIEPAHLYCDRCLAEAAAQDLDMEAEEAMLHEWEDWSHPQARPVSAEE